MRPAVIVEIPMPSPMKIMMFFGADKGLFSAPADIFLPESGPFSEEICPFALVGLPRFVFSAMHAVSKNAVNRINRAEKRFRYGDLTVI